MLPTTAAVLEIFIIGVEALAWIALFALAILPPRIHPRPVAGSSELTIAVAALLAYALGVVVDRVADTLYKWLRDDTKVGRRVLGGWLGDAPSTGILPETGIMRLRIMAKDDGRARFLEYQRSRLRIARSTVFNLALALPAASWYLVVRTDLDIASVVGIDVLIFALLVLSALAAERIGDAYHGRLVDAYRMWQNEDEALAKKEHETFGEQIRPSCRRYAAVPYRVGDGADRPPLQLLVVRTSGGAHWTFPKGRKDSKKEDGCAAARREAEEEAGVTGEIEKHPFHRYPFPASDDECDEHLVKAYLLAVRTEGVERSGKEARRELRWDTPERVADLLAEGRKPRYAKAHRDLVDAVVAELAISNDPAGRAPCT